MVRVVISGVGAALAMGLVSPPDAAAQIEPKHHECHACHDLHGGGYAALTAYATSEDLCLSCHSEAGPVEYPIGGLRILRAICHKLNGTRVLPCIRRHTLGSSVGTFTDV